MRLFSLFLALTVVASPVYAGPGADGEAAPAAAAQRQGSPDFLFGRPRGSVGIRGSLTIPRAESDWYDLVTREFTIDRGDFKAAGISADVGIAVRPQVEAVIGVDFAGRSLASEYRNFVDDDRLPIVQTSRLLQTGITGGVRVALTPSGRNISEFAWIPARLIPYVGGGAGMVYYELKQRGDFVDIADFSVFSDVFESTGWAPAVYLNGGVDVQLLRRLYLAVDVKYQWAESDLNGREWQNFEPLDLSGVRISTGINVLF